MGTTCEVEGRCGNGKSPPIFLIPPWRSHTSCRLLLHKRGQRYRWIVNQPVMPHPAEELRTERSTTRGTRRKTAPAAEYLGRRAQEANIGGKRGLEFKALVNQSSKELQAIHGSSCHTGSTTLDPISWLPKVEMNQQKCLGFDVTQGLAGPTAGGIRSWENLACQMVSPCSLHLQRISHSPCSRILQMPSLGSSLCGHWGLGPHSDWRASGTPCHRS